MTLFTPDKITPFPYPGDAKKLLKGILSRSEALERAIEMDTIITLRWLCPKRETHFYFFSDDHLFGYGVLPNSVIPVTFYLFTEDAVAPNDIKRMDTNHSGMTQITTVEQLCNELNVSFAE